MVEIMETDGASNTVDQDITPDGQGNDVGEIHFQEVGLPNNRAIGDIANDHEE